MSIAVRYAIFLGRRCHRPPPLLTFCHHKAKRPYLLPSSFSYFSSISFFSSPSGGGGGNGDGRGIPFSSPSYDDNDDDDMSSSDVASSRRVGHRGYVGGYNFGTLGYASCFSDLPFPDKDEIRNGALRYLDEEFDPQSWYDDPVTTILNGKKLGPTSSSSSSSNLRITKDAFGKPNGHQYLATPSQVVQIEEHIRTYRSPHRDIRDPIRRIEQKLLAEYSGFLIGNQCVDFHKQDGVTEIEESIMANQVERRLNDLLLADEDDGKIMISRKPIYVSCVSNFTNFLDLFRKTIRNLELGIPCVVLGRSNTVQHSYRWAQLLTDLLANQDIVDSGMLTYASCSLEDVVRITASCRDVTGALYATCSRPLAQTIRSNYGHNTVASTGGPNTMVTTRWNASVADAIRTSATIECAGQCTALRHAVVPGTVTAEDVEQMFDSAGTVAGGPDALRDGVFDGLLEGRGKEEEDASSILPPIVGEEGGGKPVYAKHKTRDAYYAIRNAEVGLPPDNLEEYWRRAVVDITASCPTSASDVDKLNDLAGWLRRNQPISLAVNGPRATAMSLGRALFERTGLVVYTIGGTAPSGCGDKYDDEDDAPPAMTCQARPQEAEIFGEFPPRKLLGEYTKFPVVVPSSTPSYDSAYWADYLERLTSSDIAAVGRGGGTVDGGGDDDGLGYVRRAIDAIDSNPTAKGYCVELANYLSDATSINPKRGYGSSRTALWGLQRPPFLPDSNNDDGDMLSSSPPPSLKTCIRCESDVSYGDALPTVLPFYATNARELAEISIDSRNESLVKIIDEVGIGKVIDIKVEDRDLYERRMLDEADSYYNAVRVKKGGGGGGGEGGMEEYPMPGQFVSLFFPLGHIKSTKSNDEGFVEFFSKSDKWLKLHLD